MNIVQISDFHLFKNRDMKLNGYNTYECLESVVNDIINEVELDANAVYITGDISEDRSVASYQLALEQIERIGLPIYYLAGNHDDSDELDTVFKSSVLVSAEKSVVFNGWDLIKIDTVKKGHDSGFITDDEKHYVRQRIMQSKSANIALFMHHHPLKVGIPIVDACKLSDEEFIKNLIIEHPRLKSVICGHAHTLYSEKVNQCLIDVCPATCFQWKDGAISIDCENMRGYKLLSFDQEYSSKMMFS